ncbi:SdrD B-like domain-containing protein [Taibaiella helva]|uniref:SdrD B-like domain-containing protein n=1 Tax=Taibaiella helva TaxID=2301235 RepID=UPI000E588521|nr:SdrD B-like domain-containing protein [Taibaiella helva]
MTLYAANGTTVLATATTDANGNYSFPGQIPGNYVVGVAPPAGYQHVSSTDATPGNGLTSVTITTTAITDINFGIERPPVSNSQTQTIGSPTSAVIPAGTISQDVEGSDPEDGSLGNANTIVITQLPTNAVVLYNGLAVTLNQQITGFDPSLLSYSDIASGTTSIVFNYTFIDAAGLQGVPATYTVNWTTPLPLTLLHFVALPNECNEILLKWAIADAIGFDRFEVEESRDGASYQKIAILQYTDNVTSYVYKQTNPAPGKHYYRLKMLDIDSRYSYSRVLPVMIDCKNKDIEVFPNPTNSRITIRELSDGDQIQLLTPEGRILTTREVKGHQVEIDLTAYTNGTYYINLIDRDRKKKYWTKVIKVK